MSDHVSMQANVLGDDGTALEIRVGTLLDRVASELDLAAVTAQDLQTVLSPILAQSGMALASQKIQGLDLLEQTLRDLSAVLCDMAKTHAASAALDGVQVLSRCKLAAVACRLSGAETLPPQDDLELF